VDHQHTSDPDIVVLQTLRCIGFAGEDRVASAAGLTIVEARRRLSELAGGSLVSNASGPFGGWALSAAYRAFLALNPVFLQVSADWQMIRIGDSHTVNDHRDRDYDNEVLDRLLRVDDRVQPIAADLGSRLSRFAKYGPRMSAALNRALAGDHAFVADHLESYHNVWFQLHEDLLVTVGISREAGRSSPASE
jgi:hypothetical protein